MVGHVPERRHIKSSSGTLIDYVEIVQFSRPSEFLTHAQLEGIRIVSAELVEEARPLSTYNFNFSRPLCVVVGNEEVGVPTEILVNSDVVYIDMPGVGFCLNTSQAANIMLYEAVKQYEISDRQN